MSLEALQSRFAAALSDASRDTELMPDLLHRDGRDGERIALYRGNLVAAWSKALAAAFPIVKALVGDPFFDALARVYGHAYPSSSGDLNRFGEHFPMFVAEFEHTRPLPYLPDVAALEWIIHRAHYAADAAPVSRTRIAGLLPHELLAMRFGLHPACGWLPSPYPIASIWLAHQPQPSCDLPDTIDREEFALVVRPRWRVEIVASSAAEIAALATLRAGDPLEAGIEAALAIDPAFDLPASLLRWLDLAVLAPIAT